MSNGKVWLVGAGPGDPTLITVRGLELLKRADVVLHDALAHRALLDECRPDALLIDVGKRAGLHALPQTEISQLLIEHARQGKQIVRLKGGDPYLFARGTEEAEALVAGGIEFGVVPGISSPVGTSTYAGFSLTHRDLSSSVTFATGTDKHGQPRSPADWHKLAQVSDTLCILMGMRRIEAITAALVAGGRPANQPAAVVEWGARPEQRVLVAELGTLAARVRAEGLSNPGMIVVGDVVTLREQLRWYDKQPLFGRRVLIPRPPRQALETARLVRERGAEPILLPLIAIEEPPEPAAFWAAVARLADYDWVLFTSANGAERTRRELERQGKDARAFAAARIGVIGPKTALPLESWGLKPDLIASEYIAELLAEELIALGGGRKVLLLRALEARSVLPEQLRAAGYEVDVVAAYQTRSLADAARESLLALGNRPHLVLLTSASMARAFSDALGEQRAALLPQLTLASIGPVTTRSAEAHGLPIAVTAEVYTIAGLLDALEAALPGPS